jgi:hypothetical protein
LQGLQGSTGPSTAINASTTNGGTNYYVIGVAASGSNQTPIANGGMYFNGSTLYSTAFFAKSVTNASVSGSFNIDLATATLFNYTLTGAATTFAFINPPVTGNVHSFTVVVKQSASTTVTPAWTNVKWAGGSLPPTTLTANAVDIWSFMTWDGGTTYYGTLGAKDIK